MKKLIQVNTVFFITLFSVLLGLSGLYLFENQKEAVHERIVHTGQELENTILDEFKVVSASLHLLRSHLEILKSPLSSQEKIRVIRSFMREALERNQLEYNTYVALDRAKSRQYFRSEGQILLLRRHWEPEAQEPFDVSAGTDWKVFDNPAYQNDPNEGWYQIAKRSREVEFTDMYFDSTYMKKWMVSAGLGIYSEDGVFEGMVGADILLDQLSLLTSGFKFGQTGGVLIFDSRSGRVLTSQSGSSQGLLRIENRYDKPQMPPEKLRTWHQIMQGPGRVVDFKGDDGKTYLLSAHPLKKVPWVIVSFQESNEAFRPVFLQISLLIAVALAALVFLIWTSKEFSALVLMPLDRLMDSLSENIRFAEKDEVMKVNVKTRGYFEVQRVSELVNQLVNVVNQRMQDHLKAIELQRAKVIHSAQMASIGQMAGNVAHEINNPLAAISLYAEVLEDGLAQEKDLRPSYLVQVQKIRGLTDRIAQIVKGFLTLSRDSISAPAAEAPLQGIVQDALNVSQKRFANHQIELNVDPIPDVVIFGRRLQISQVLLGLLSNARDAIQFEKEKWIRIRFSVTEEIVQIKVINSGGPIPASIAAKMMEPFFTTKDVNQGAGLGLSIAKNIIEEHQGRLYYDPSVAEGTCFIVELPRI